MRLTRRKLLLAGGAGAVLAAGGVYELVDQLTGAPSRARGGAGGLPPEQHVLRGVRLVEDNGVEVVVPPLHHQLVTAKLAVSDRAERSRRCPVASSSRRCRSWSRSSSRRPPGSGSRSRGACRTSARTSRSSPGAHSRRPPRDEDGEQARSGSCSTRGGSRAIPPERSSRPTTSRCSCAATGSTTSPMRSKALFEDLDLFRVTSIRKGFAGGGFDGGRSLPKRMAVAAQVPGSYLIPDEAELFLGFTSTQKAGLGPRRSRTSRSSGSARPATSATERTSPSRTSRRISRPGTSTSRTRSGSRPSSARG